MSQGLSSIQDRVLDLLFLCNFQFLCTVTESKNASLAMKSRQQVLNEVNKRRTLLQDNSWIKKRPEEEK